MTEVKWKKAQQNTYIIKKDGGIAMAQFANLPSRLFHIFFGQPPVEGKQHKTGNSRLKKHKMTPSAVSKDCHFSKLYSNWEMLLWLSA